MKLSEMCDWALGNVQVDGHGKGVTKWDLADDLYAKQADHTGKRIAILEARAELAEESLRRIDEGEEGISEYTDFLKANVDALRAEWRPGGQMHTLKQKLEGADRRAEHNATLLNAAEGKLHDAIALLRRIQREGYYTQDIKAFFNGDRKERVQESIDRVMDTHKDLFERLAKVDTIDFDKIPERTAETQARLDAFDPPKRDHWEDGNLIGHDGSVLATYHELDDDGKRCTAECPACAGEVISATDPGWEETADPCTHWKGFPCGDCGAQQGAKEAYITTGLEGDEDCEVLGAGTFNFNDHQPGTWDCECGNKEIPVPGMCGQCGGAFDRVVDTRPPNRVDIKPQNHDCKQNDCQAESCGKYDHRWVQRLPKTSGWWDCKLCGEKRRDE
jgi:hypothetical protein